MTQPRLALATAAGTAAGAVSRFSGRGQGVVLRGRTILALAPDAMAQLSAGRFTVLVTGTNGKTTTTAMTVAALGGGVATNHTGANMEAGIVEAYARSSCRTAVIEVDELYVSTVGQATVPRVLVALNLSRDHMDRMHEVSSIAHRWSDFLDCREIHVIANAKDPNVVAAVGSRPATWIDPGWEWRADSVICPRCSALLEWHPSTWSCSCGLQQPPADYVVDRNLIHRPLGESIRLNLAIPGAVNVGNSAFAIAVAEHLGVSPNVARIEQIGEVSGRYGSVLVGDRTARTLLSKNPSGWASVLPTLADDDVLIISVNAREADGYDTSWLWEVPFETLAGRAVGVHGEQQAALALRLTTAGVVPVVDSDLDRLARRLPPGPCTILANYTAFAALRGRR